MWLQSCCSGELRFFHPDIGLGVSVLAVPDESGTKRYQKPKRCCAWWCLRPRLPLLFILVFLLKSAVYRVCIFINNI